MIESTNPTIDVNELMERVRRKAAEPPPAPNGQARPRTSVRRAAFPALREAPSPPNLEVSLPMESIKVGMDGLLLRMRRMTEVSARIPKMFRGFFRRQGGFNGTALDAIAALAEANEALGIRVRELSGAAGAQHEWSQALSTLRQTETAWMSAVQDRITRLGDWQMQMERHGEHLRNLQSESDRQGKLLQEFRGQRNHLGEHLRNLQIESDRNGELSRALRQVTERQGVRLQDLQGQAERVGEHLRNLQGEGEKAAQDQRNLSEMLVQYEERQLQDAIYIKGELSQQRALLQRWLDVASPSRDDAAAGAVTPPAGLDAHRLDSFYLSFENRFRGERSAIKERVRFYLPLLHEAAAGTPGRPIIDLGCGRGEWLELLKENGLEALGLDLNKAMVAQCQARNLDVTLGDAIAYLRSLSDDTQGAVTGFHIIEHLPWETLIDLFAEARRVLRPGGLAIFESPNCKNLMVGACNFNVDPTHRNPVFPETAQFMLATQGFEKIQLEYLSPVDTSRIPDIQNLAPAIYELLYGPQDFAVIAHKPMSR